MIVIKNAAVQSPPSRAESETKGEEQSCRRWVQCSFSAPCRYYYVASGRFGAISPLLAPSTKRSI